MDFDLIQQTRSKLQRRRKRLAEASFPSFHGVLLQVWRFLQENELTKAVLDDLQRRKPSAENKATEIIGGRILTGSTETDNVAICHALMKQCASSGSFDYLSKVGTGLVQEGPNLVPHVTQKKQVEAFCQIYVDPLFDYLDEQINDQRMVLLLLKKFKEKCEWFKRASLLEKVKADTREGEHVLAFDLYEYLHDQGVHFHIEPKSASGRIDLISSQVGRDRLVADVKIFDPKSGHDCAYIIKGFRQVYDYARDFNEPFGYLVIFKLCENDLSIAAANLESSVPFFIHNNKSIFFLVIDICPYDDSASKRGKLKAHEITAQQLVQSLEQPINKAD